MEPKKNNLMEMPSRIRFYLLDWKDSNLDEFLNEYGNVGLKDLSIEQLYELFKKISDSDYSAFNIFGKHYFEL